MTHQCPSGNVKAEIWRLEEELKRTKEELTQLEARKKELEASGLSITPVVSPSLSGLSKGVLLQLGQIHPIRKRGRVNKKDTLTCPHKRWEYYKSYLVHL